MRAVGRQLKRGLIDLYWTVRGPRIRVPAVPANPRSVLFVCKGNICRSPFAEHLASKLGREGIISGIKFGSAGLHVPKPTPSPEAAIQVARHFGVDLENHRSLAISQDLVESYDMIIAMEVWQYTVLQSSFERHHAKLFLLPLLDPDRKGQEQGYAAFNIQDPYGGTAGAFEKCFERISQCIERTFKLNGR
ncbi:low molecular weight phosphatase family protein [Nitrospira sp. BLG_2]|uniref:arsenate-mycothiol transferase ArsC n=1 Tax=Nitrospira sp. BLG_2 TaxID=3397507 RepID=UPI003B9A0928